MQYFSSPFVLLSKWDKYFLPFEPLTRISASNCDNSDFLNKMCCGISVSLDSSKCHSTDRCLQKHLSMEWPGIFTDIHLPGLVHCRELQLNTCLQIFLELVLHILYIVISYSGLRCLTVNCAVLGVFLYICPFLNYTSMKSASKQNGLLSYLILFNKKYI